VLPNNYPWWKPVGIAVNSAENIPLMYKAASRMYPIENWASWDEKGIKLSEPV
jgi:hypothetical protein